MPDFNWLVLMTVFGVSLFACACIVLTQRWHGKLSLDHDLTGVQKIHGRPVPRIGGVAIGAGIAIGAVATGWRSDPISPQLQFLLLCAIPAFGAGLIEDLTKRVSVRARLVASFLSAGLAVWLIDAYLTRLTTPGLDGLMTILPMAMLFTCFAVGGVTNAINIIDGLNGLASGCVVLMLGGLAGMAWFVGDLLVLQLCGIGMAAILGFMVLNFPFGRIFLGDGGAYLVGFWLAECGVLLLARNPTVSTWAVLLACIYPVWETAFSMFRRHVVGGVSSGLPDVKHFHHLVLRQHASARASDATPPWVSHAWASSSIWSLVAICQVVAVAFFSLTPLMVSAIVMFGLVYQGLYRIMASHGGDVEDDAQANHVTIERA